MEWRPKSRSKIGPDDGKKSKQSSLKIHLEHGDIMVMHGTQIQKLYEVSALSPL
jgi:alkylated DNA repair dioxygenase AlkB